jgi:hypothetical protein
MSYLCYLVLSLCLLQNALRESNAFFFCTELLTLPVILPSSSAVRLSRHKIQPSEITLTANVFANYFRRLCIGVIANQVSV